MSIVGYVDFTGPKGGDVLCVKHGEKRPALALYYIHPDDEFDTPAHCENVDSDGDVCEELIPATLTLVGIQYVREAIANMETHGWRDRLRYGRPEMVALWEKHYEAVLVR